MSTDIESIKRKLLIKYPTFGSVIANLEFQSSKDIATAGTDGKVLLYNPKFIGGLSEKEQIFIFAHVVCHVAFEHIFRSEGKDKRLWNIATDSVINALLKQDGLPIVEGFFDIPEAINYDAEGMYKKLLEEEKKKQEQQSQQGKQGEQDSQEQNDSQSSQGQQNSQKNQERKKEQQEQEGKKEKEQKQTKKEEKNERTEGEESVEKKKREGEEKSKFAEQGERETFKQNRIEKTKQLQELGRKLASESSRKAGDGIQREGKNLSDIGIATPLIDWRKLLRQEVGGYDDYTRRYARMRKGDFGDFLRHRVRQIRLPEAEILLDTSGSVSEVLLKNFLRECKNILDDSKVKVGCFNTEFHGFTELKKPEDIDNISFPIGGGTNFNAAVGAFSRKASNKIIFTDGEAPMPRVVVRNVIWVVFGDKKINPEGGIVINITGEQLRRLYQSFIQNKDDISR